jgi:hypothetical protein
LSCELALGVFVTVQAQLGIERKVGVSGGKMLEKHRIETAVRPSAIEGETDNACHHSNHVGF